MPNQATQPTKLPSFATFLLKKRKKVVNLPKITQKIVNLPSFGAKKVEKPGLGSFSAYTCSPETNFRTPLLFSLGKLI